VTRISIIAHSWGCIVSGRFAGRCPELIERLTPAPNMALFGGNFAPEYFG
jgi:hypothetical protein